MRAISTRGLEWRVAIAWIVLVFAVLLVPSVSSRDPFLLNHSIGWHVAELSLLAHCIVLTAWPIATGTMAVRLLAVACAVLAASRLANWLVLLISEPASLSGIPLFD